MQKHLLLFIVVFITLACNSNPKQINKNIVERRDSIVINAINQIPMPKGFERIMTDSNTFEFYLQHFALKNDNTVYYYDGTKKEDQQSHYAVLDIDMPNKDLQQCADAIMRLRAEYFFKRKEYDKIEFKNNRQTYNFQEFLKHTEVETYEKGYSIFMQQVFINCGTYNLEDMLYAKQNANDLTIGDVFVKGGSPGHAMIVVDCAVNKSTNEKIFLLAQSFMPSQSMHIVINPNDKSLSPWYKVDTTDNLITPGYRFYWQQLKSW